MESSYGLASFLSSTRATLGFLYRVLREVFFTKIPALPFPLSITTRNHPFTFKLRLNCDRCLHFTDQSLAPCRASLKLNDRNLGDIERQIHFSILSRETKMGKGIFSQPRRYFDEREETTPIRFHSFAGRTKRWEERDGKFLFLDGFLASPRVTRPARFLLFPHGLHGESMSRLPAGREAFFA